MSNSRPLSIETMMYLRVPSSLNIRGDCGPACVCYKKKTENNKPIPTASYNEGTQMNFGLDHDRIQYV